MPTESPPSSAPKIAIKSFSLKPTPKSETTKSVLGKRPRTALYSGDSGDEENGNGGVEEVSGFDEGGALGGGGEKKEKEREGPLVIERVGNRDWRGEVRRRNLLGREVQGEVKWGLSGGKRVKVDGDGMGMDTTSTKEIGDSSNGEDSKPEQTEDELALAALLCNGPKAPDLIIPHQANETSAYRAAVASAPEVSTLAQYEEIPVEQFGAALLRGMGWKGDNKDVRRKEVKRRPNLLGLGARELGDAEELGAWVQKVDVRRLRPGGEGGGKGKKGFVRPGDYRRERERGREGRGERERGSGRDGRGDGGRRGDMDRDGGRYRERSRSRDRGSRRDDRDRGYERRRN